MLEFIFVCQSGELETKAALLAASIRAHYGTKPLLVAAVPQPEEEWGALQPDTIEFLERLNVRRLPIENPIGIHYPIGNKISCLERRLVPAASPSASSARDRRIFAASAI